MSLLAARKGFRRAARTRRSFAFALCLLLALVALPLTRATMQSPTTETPSQNKGLKAEFVPGRVLVRFRTGEAMADVTKGGSSVLALRTRAGREISAEVKNFDGSEMVEGLRIAHVAAEDTLRAVEAFNARPDVLYAEPDYIWRTDATPNDPQYPGQYAMQRISAPQAWDRTTGSNSVVVAVIDGGVDVTHQDLQGNIWTNPGEVANNGIDDDANGFIDDVNGWDFAHNDKTVFDNEDGDDHGTHVAGTIGARGNNNIGVVGVSWQVSIMSVKVLSPTGGSVSGIINGYNYVRMMRQRGVNVRVTNNSYGGVGKSQAALDAINQLNAAGILFVAAAGNDGTDNFNFPHFPSNYDAPNVLAVASSTDTDTLSSFSNFGARAVSMGAPGSGILSTYPANFPRNTSHSQYATFSGTSMASPHVAGTAALACSAVAACRDSAAINSGISVANLRGVLAFSGDVLASLEGKTTTGRRLNANASVASAQENDVTGPASPANLQVTAQSGRSVTLSWNAPGDDGNSGQAADYDFVFINPTTGARLALPTNVLPGAPGSVQSATVNLPFRNFSGSVELRAYDNAGNYGAASVPVTVTQNAGSDPYVQSLGAASGLSTGGSAMSLIGDDVYRENYPLPFSFPFFGTPRNSITVSSNGALYFSRIPRDEDDPTISLDAGSSIEGLNGQQMIAGMWDDLRTDRGGDVFVLQPDASHIIFRWQAVTFNTPLSNGTQRGEQPVNFEIELASDGTIVMRYGAGQAAPINTRLFPVVGIGGGEPDAYVISSHTSENSLKNLTNAQSVVFQPRPNTPTPNQSPTVSLVTPSGGNFASPGQIGLLANASDPDGSIVKVEFFANGSLIGTVTNPQSATDFQFIWNASGSGPVALTAVATDNRGATTTSSTVNITLVNQNPIDNSDFFVRQHYADFLNRTPDASGLAFWTNNIESCGFNVPCREVKRIDTSAAYFLSIEFQETSYLVYRMYKAAYGNIPGKPVPVTFQEFLPDTQTISQGVIIGEPGSEQQLEANKQAFANAFVNRARFTTAYPAAMPNTQFVDTLNANTGNSLTQAERNTLVSNLDTGVQTRAQVLRAVAQAAEFARREKNRAFVLSQYFGYLRRNPDDAPNTDFAGYNFWLGKLDSFGGDFRAAEMVKAFITSGEYRGRFGPQ